MIRFFDYWRSSAAYRVRIALHLKNVEFERSTINLAPGTDQQFSDDYARANPQMRVPAIELSGEVSGQSLAIVEWIDETCEGPSLLPADPWKRLQARAFADTIACDIHPLNNLSVLKELRTGFGATEDQIMAWYHDWIARGFSALEVQAKKFWQDEFLFGDHPGIAEIALVPQVYNARRFKMDLAAFPTLVALDEKCRDLEAFKRAAPDANKPD